MRGVAGKVGSILGLKETKWGSRFPLVSGKRLMRKLSFLTPGRCTEFSQKNVNREIGETSGLEKRIWVLMSIKGKTQKKAIRKITGKEISLIPFNRMAGAIPVPEVIFSNQWVNNKQFTLGPTGRTHHCLPKFFIFLRM